MRTVYKSGKPVQLPTALQALKPTWLGMLDRCEYIFSPSYKNYGARGITVSKEWHDFNTFAKDMGPKPTPKHQIDRIDNDKGYYKENCRWVTPLVNSQNKRQNARWVKGKKRVTC